MMRQPKPEETEAIAAKMQAGTATPEEVAWATGRDANVPASFDAGPMAHNPETPPGLYKVPQRAGAQPPDAISEESGMDRAIAKASPPRELKGRSVQVSTVGKLSVQRPESGGKLPDYESFLAMAPQDRAALIGTSVKPPAEPGLADAQMDAASRRLGASIGRAGSTIAGGISGKQQDQSQFDDMEKSADDPVKAYVTGQEAKKKAAATDPNSPESKRLQAAISSNLPGQYKPEELALITAADKDMVLDVMKMKSALEERASNREFQAKEHELNREAQRSNAELNRQAARDNRAASMDLKMAESVDRRREKFGDKVNKSEPVLSSLRRLDHLVGGFSGDKDIAGIGGYKNWFPSAMMTAEGEQVRGAAADLAANVLKYYSGSAYSDKELMNTLDRLGQGKFNNQAQFRDALTRVRDFVAAQQRNLEAGAGPEVVGGFREGGGTTNEAISQIGGGSQPPEAGMVRIQDPKTGRTGWAKPGKIPPGAVPFNG